MSTRAIASARTQSTSQRNIEASASRDRVASVLLVLCALGALAATAGAAVELSDTDGNARLAETWRLFGFPVFAGLFLILAHSPRRVGGLWELVIANKLALAVAGATFLSGVDGANEFVYIDGALVVLIGAAYVLTRGWTAWRNQ